MRKAGQCWNPGTAGNPGALLKLLLLLVSLLGYQGRTAVVVGREVVGRFHLAQSARGSRRADDRRRRKATVPGG